MNKLPSERNTTFQLKRALKAEDECCALQAKITEIAKAMGVAWLLVDQHKDRLVELDSTVLRLRGELAQAEQVLREIAEHVSQYSDHTEDSFRRGLMALMAPTHKALKAAARELDPDMDIWNTYAPVGHKTP